jgi:DNA replication and repair protein RecF
VWLTTLEADRLRNVKAIQLDLPAGLTVVVGRNGQGKSSLLEAVYLLGTGRSFRTRKLDELLHWEGGTLRVAGTVEGIRGRTRLTVVMHGDERSLLADGLEQNLEKFIGRLDLIDLTAERMKTLRGGPEDRRRFLDRGVVGLRPGFLLEIGEYRRALQQRNALLRRMSSGAGPRGMAELDVWDERLVRALFPGAGELVLVYRPSPSSSSDAAPEDFAEVFARETAAGRSRDLAVGHTCRGPHRDEMRVELDGVDLRKFGSAGQVRASMIALKLGKLSLLQTDRGEAPLFLMDDFDTDLDEARAAALAGFLERGGFQVLVATSKENLVERLGVTFTRVRMDGGVARAD